MARKQFKLPDLGEGLTEGEILRWLVAPGDVVTLNQIIVEVETAKAAVEVPSPYAGTVVELHYPEGSVVDVGSPLITFEVEGAAPDREKAPSAVTAAALGTGGDEQFSVLVGSGPRPASTRRRPRNRGAVSVPAAHSPGRVLAKPPVRKLARDLGVDLMSVVPTGPDGTVTREDVQAATDGQSAPRSAGGGERRVPVRGVRRMTADAMVRSAFTAPHVTVFLQVDATRSMELLARLEQRREFAGQRLSPLLLVAKAVLLAVSRTPEVNATWDEDAQEIVLKDYVNLGIAVASPRGLLVPNIKGAERLTLVELAAAITELATTAREGRATPADMQGGTFTISNIGVFGVDAGTPIINPGESAILAVGAVRPMPWAVDGEVVVRQVGQLSLSFDHRLVDGEQGSRFLADVGALLEHPELALTY